MTFLSSSFPGFWPAEEMIPGSHPSALVATEERISLSYGPGPAAQTPVLQRRVMSWLVSLPDAETFYFLVLEVIRLDVGQGGGAGGSSADLDAFMDCALDAEEELVSPRPPSATWPCLWFPVCG